MVYRLLITAYHSTCGIATQVVPYGTAEDAKQAMDEIRQHAANRSLNAALRFSVLPLDPGIEVPR